MTAGETPECEPGLYLAHLPGDHEIPMQVLPSGELLWMGMTEPNADPMADVAARMAPWSVSELASVIVPLTPLVTVPDREVWLRHHLDVETITLPESRRRIPGWECACGLVLTKGEDISIPEASALHLAHLMDILTSGQS